MVLSLRSATPLHASARPPAAIRPVPLSDPEFDHVQRAVERHLATLLARGLRVHVRRDFDRYCALRRAHGDHHLNQAFDPDHVRFDKRDFWLLIEQQDASPVATYCLRVLETENVYTEILTQRLWFGSGPRLVDPRFEIDCAIPPFGGVVASSGGMWVHPARRGAGVSWIVPRLARALALRNSSIEHDFGMVLNNPDPARLAVRNYGYARVEVMTDGWFPPEQADMTVHLCHADRAECLASLIERPAAHAA